jgi:hypothetical protein
VAIIHAGVKATVERGGEEPNHFLLYGPPAGAKTRVFKALKAFYEQGRAEERVAILDATTLSKAGLEKWLVERAQAGTLPLLLVLEEVEKHKPENLLCLLSVMASGEISRTNARIGHVVAQTKIIIGATCNDEDALKQFHRGALWSRFGSNQLYCPRPDRAMMKMILLDKIRTMRGSPAWCEPVLAYSYEEVGCDDPRFIVGLLDGKEGLEDGSYLARHRRIRESRLKDLERRGVLEQKRLEEAAFTMRNALARDRQATLRMLGLAPDGGVV